MVVLELKHPPIKVKAIANFIPQQPDELGFNTDEIILIGGEAPAKAGWWLGENGKGKKGLVPCVHLACSLPLPPFQGDNSFLFQRITGNGGQLKTRKHQVDSSC